MKIFLGCFVAGFLIFVALGGRPPSMNAVHQAQQEAEGHRAICRAYFHWRLTTGEPRVEGMEAHCYGVATE